jgi:mRNA-degrading endonuclease toxin of MazEF toxin-antitoxin module
VVNQGEVYDHVVAGSRYRVAVVSSDAHNATGKPAWIAPVRHGRIDAPPYLVALADTDPLGGALDIDRMIRATPAGESIGLLTGATVDRVRQAIYTLFAG